MLVHTLNHQRGACQSEITWLICSWRYALLCSINFILCSMIATRFAGSCWLISDAKNKKQKNKGTKSRFPECSALLAAAQTLQEKVTENGGSSEVIHTAIILVRVKSKLKEGRRRRACRSLCLDAGTATGGLPWCLAAAGPPPRNACVAARPPLQEAAGLPLRVWRQAAAAVKPIGGRTPPLQWSSCPCRQWQMQDGGQGG